MYKLAFFIGISATTAVLSYLILGKEKASEMKKAIKINIPISIAKPSSKKPKISSGFEIQKPEAPNYGTSTPVSSLCGQCGKQTTMPFRCRRCGGLFCSEHRLPEAHNRGQ